MNLIGILYFLYYNGISSDALPVYIPDSRLTRRAIGDDPINEILYLYRNHSFAVVTKGDVIEEEGSYEIIESEMPIADKLIFTSGITSVNSNGTFFITSKSDLNAVTGVLLFNTFGSNGNGIEHKFVLRPNFQTSVSEHQSGVGSTSEKSFQSFPSIPEEIESEKAAIDDFTDHMPDKSVKMTTSSDSDAEFPISFKSSAQKGDEATDEVESFGLPSEASSQEINRQVNKPSLSAHNEEDSNGIKFIEAPSETSHDTRKNSEIKMISADQVEADIAKISDKQAVESSDTQIPPPSTNRPNTQANSVDDVPETRVRANIGTAAVDEASSSDAINDGQTVPQSAPVAPEQRLPPRPPSQQLAPQQVAPQPVPQPPSQQVPPQPTPQQLPQPPAQQLVPKPLSPPAVPERITPSENSASESMLGRLALALIEKLTSKPSPPSTPPPAPPIPVSSEKSTNDKQANSVPNIVVNVGFPQSSSASPVQTDGPMKNNWSNGPSITVVKVPGL